MAAGCGEWRTEAPQVDVTGHFPVLSIDSWTLKETESSGGSEHDWFESPERSVWLFKPRTEQTGWSQGEDWAEKIATEVAVRLGVPVARVELAVRGGRAGTVSLRLRPPGWELQHGALLLAGLLPDYVPRSRERTGHGLENIEQVLKDVQPPQEVLGMTAFEAFAGYLVLDALVANQDRHEENWAVLRPLPGEGGVRLAGSYDHGSSLGFNLTDHKRRVELDRHGVAAFAGRARAQRFDRAAEGRLTLVQLAHRALARCSTSARNHWLAALAAIDEAFLADTVALVPAMSDPARSFTSALLLTNRRRLLDEH